MAKESHLNKREFTKILKWEFYIKIWFSTISEAFKMQNQKIWTIKQASLEKRHNNLSNDILLSQNGGRQYHKVSSQNWKEILNKLFFKSKFIGASLCNKLYKFSNNWFKSKGVNTVSYWLVHLVFFVPMNNLVQLHPYFVSF